MKFLGEMLNFYWETPKKVVKKFGSPVSEILDPLVAVHIVI